MKLLHEERLEGVHPDLVGVIKLAATHAPFNLMILEGVRSKERQKELLKRGASKTMNSRHLIQKCGFGCAVDVAPVLDGGISWHWPDYHKLAPVVKKVAKQLEIPVEWGGDWKSFPDGPHWQLSWEEYE